MCIATLDNRRTKLSFYAKNGQNVRRQWPFVVVILFTLVPLGAGCRSRPESPEVSIDTGDEAAAAEKIKEADQLYAEREELSRVRLALALLRQARVADYGSYEAAWKLARTAYYLGDHSNDEKEQEDAFREGIHVGRIAVDLKPDRPEGHFWLGANYGGDAEISTLASLANVEDIRTQMEAVISIDETYESGSAYIGLGKLYLSTPRVLGGDTQIAISHLEKGLRVGSDNAMLKLTLAQAYHAAKRNGDARKQIAELLKMTPHPDYLPEYNEAVKEAQKLQEQIERS